MAKNSAQEVTGKVIENWINAKDGVPIYSKTWKAVSEPPIATVVFIHGFGEHINRYNYVFSKFSSKKIEVYAYDQRGFGQTAVWNNNRGIFEWDKGFDDITEALIAQRKPGIPQFLMGQSMGGGLTLRYANEGQEKDNLAGFIATSPLITTAKNRTLVYKAGNFLSNIIPNCPISINLNPKDMSHDPEAVEEFRNDSLIIKSCSLKTIATILKETRSLLESKYNKNINSPVYICHGSGDNVNSELSTQTVYNRIPSKDKTYRRWEGLYHEMHTEFEKDQVIDDYLQWILARVIKD